MSKTIYKIDDRRRENADPFQGDDSDVEARTAKVVVTRKSHECLVPYFGHKTPKKFPAGTKMWREKALVDGEWQTNYVCLQCIDRHIEEYES